MNQEPLSFGTRVKNDLNAIVGAQERIRPLRDQIIVEPLEWEPSKIIAVAYFGEVLRGIVRAAGPGTWLKQYATGRPVSRWWPTHAPPPKGERTASRDSKIFRPTEVKVGDTVELGGLELKGYLNNTFTWGARKVVLCREEDVCVVTADG